MIITLLAAVLIGRLSILDSLLPPLKSLFLYSGNFRSVQSIPPIWVAGPYEFHPGLHRPKTQHQPLRGVNEVEANHRDRKTKGALTVLPQNSASSLTPLSHSAQKRISFQSLPKEDRLAAQWAWQYFQQNWQAKTGFINSVEKYPWTTWWDQGSAIIGLHAAYQLQLIGSTEFDQKIRRLLNTLQALPLPQTGLPNKAYSTASAQMRTLDNRPDPQGTQGWSALDMARLLISLHILRTHYPAYSQQINTIVKQWQLSKLTLDGWLQGGDTSKGGFERRVQEGRLGYEQYAAYGLLLWGIDAPKARYATPTKPITIENMTLFVDRRNLSNSNASNVLTNDPYILWGIELGLPSNSQAARVLAVQRNRFKRTNILTAVNEDSIDRPPYFVYSSIYANGQSWNVVSSKGKSFPDLRLLSTKAAFGWEALFPNDPYAKALRQKVQYLADKNQGYFAGRYENKQLGINSVLNVNTNALILESILYRARQQHPLIKQ